MTVAHVYTVAFQGIAPLWSKHTLKGSKMDAPDSISSLVSEINALKEEVKFLARLVSQVRDAAIGTEIAAQGIRESLRATDRANP